MKLTQTLMGYLNRVFNKDPKPFLALRLNYNGTMTWSVADEVLTTAVVGGSGAALSIDLTQFTLATLATFIAGQSGYSVSALDATRSGLSAIVLLDGCGTPAQSNGDHLYGYTSLVWAYMDAVAKELTDASVSVAAAPGMMNVVDGEGMWLDEIGGYYNVPRTSGELDVNYGPRIIAETLRPKSNNIALETAIEAYTGRVAAVTDVILGGSVTPIYDGSFNHDATKAYNGGGVPIYNLFDVVMHIDDLPPDAVDILLLMEALVGRLRAGGTHVRLLAITSGPIYDGTYYYDGTITHDGTILTNETPRYLLTEDGTELLTEDGQNLLKIP